MNAGSLLKNRSSRANNFTKKSFLFFFFKTKAVVICIWTVTFFLPHVASTSSFWQMRAQPTDFQLPIKPPTLKLNMTTHQPSSRKHFHSLNVMSSDEQSDRSDLTLPLSRNALVWLASATFMPWLVSHHLQHTDLLAPTIAHAVTCYR